MRRISLRPLAVLGLAAAASLATAASVVLFRFNPAQYGFYPRCLLFVHTGIYCPGCGALRAAHQLLHGNLVGALDYNVFFVVALPFLGYVLLSRGVHATLGRRLPTVYLPGRAVWALFGAIMTFTVLRNLPFAPFSVLAP